MNRKQQRGSVIVICLMFLMGLSLIAVSAMKVGNLNMKIIQNEMAREGLRYTVLRAVEQMLSSELDFVIGSQVIIVDGKTINLNKQCIFSQTAEGYGVNFGQDVVPINTVWEVIATASDNGVAVGMLQGIEMSMLQTGC